MRDILFRGKSYTGKWVEGAYYKQTEYYGDDYEAHIIITTKDELEDNMMTFYHVFPETVGQFTGLTDKNGKQIFEGDIVKGIFLHMRPVNGVVIFQDGAFGLEWMRGDIAEYTPFTSMCNVEYEVVGNIHDNPELLKGVTD